MLYPPPYIRSLPHACFFYCHFVFSMKCDWIAVTDTTRCIAFFVVLCTYIRGNAYCHLIGRDDENILSSCIDQSDYTIHLLRHMHTKQQSIRLFPSQRSNHRWITLFLFRLQSRGHTLWINNCMLYPPPYIRSLPHACFFYCHFVFLMKCDWIAVTDTTRCIAFFVVLCTYIRGNAYCHLIGRDDENILSSCIDQSDYTIHLLRHMHTKQQSIRLFPSQRSNHTWFKKKWVYNETVNVDQIWYMGEDGAFHCLFRAYTHMLVSQMITVKFT